LLVVGAPELIEQLDRLLWTFSDPDFLPHCRSDANPLTVAASPVMLATSLHDQAFNAQSYGVLVNLGREVPENFERFERFIEVVSSADDDRQAARVRWKHYKDRGYALKQHDRAASAQGA
jgi:DNA polymerase-3 subunit chi